MKIEKNDMLLEEILKRLQNYAAERRSDKVHVSELVYCLRKAYFRRVQPKPVGLVELGFFIDGARRHAALQALFPQSVVEKEVRKLGVIGHIDILSDLPIEFKTTRAMKNILKEHYVRQLAYYCVLANKESGALLIYSINDFKEPFHAYRITLNEDDFSMYERSLKLRRDLLKHALSKKDPSALPAGESWECRHCPYFEECGVI